VVTATQTIHGTSSDPSPPVVVERATLTHITITPVVAMTVEQGQSLLFKAKGVFSNGRIEDPLPEVRWVIENLAVATIEPDGSATGLDVGSTTIQATREGIISDNATLAVQPPPVVSSVLKAGDLIVTGSAEPLASIQLHKNGTPLGAAVQADAQGQWEASDLPMLTEQDAVTSTKMVNSISSGPSTVVSVLPNSPPVLSSLRAQKVRLGETLRFTLNASDPEGDVLTFEATQLPANSKWDSTKRLLTFTPTANQVRTIPFTFRISDGYSVLDTTIHVKVVLPRVIIILLENPGEGVGMIHVTSAGETLVLDKTGQALKLGNSTDSPRETFLLNDEVIQASFKQALEAVPDDPLTFTVYFENDSDEPSSTFRQQIPEILAEIHTFIGNREVPDISVIGHTDRTASDTYNHQLSMRRAMIIRDFIVTGGIDSAGIEVTGHGEHNPLRDTADNVSEPLNRRIEIIIR